jgi:hypothetical protein
MDDLRRFYVPARGLKFNGTVDTICEDIYSRITSGETISITKAEFDAVIDNSYDLEEFQDDVSDAIVQNLLANKDAGDIFIKHMKRKVASTLIRLSPPDGTTWMGLFQAFQCIRISASYTFGGNRIRAVSYGRPNSEVISNMTCRGGCGLSALLATGIISMSSYLKAVQHRSLLDPDAGTNYYTLWSLLLNDFVETKAGMRDAISTYKLAFRVNVNENFYDPTDPEMIQQLDEFINYLNKNIGENQATLIRLGDMDQGVPELQIDESAYGHTFIVFKHINRLYIFDTWLSSLLTLKEKNGVKWESKSFQKSCEVTAMSVLTREKLLRVCYAGGHFSVGTPIVFETFTSSFKPVINSPFEYHMAEVAAGAFSESGVRRRKLSNAAAKIINYRRAPEEPYNQRRDDTCIQRFVNGTWRFFCGEDSKRLIGGKRKTRKNRHVNRSTLKKKGRTKNRRGIKKSKTIKTNRK